MLVLDGFLSAMHRLQHRISHLCAGHRLHHSDPHVDLTTTLRLHGLDLLPKAEFVTLPITFLLGVPDLHHPAMLLTPLLVTYSIHLLDVDAGDGLLWWLLASPNCHRLHHRSPPPCDGINLAFSRLCDLLFGTAERPSNHPEHAVGLPGWRPASLTDMVLRPFADLFGRGG